MPLSAAEVLAVETLLERGRSLVKQGKHVEAAAHYRDAVQKQPRSAKLRVELSGALTAGGHFREAGNAYFEALLEGSENPVMLNGLGIALLAEGRTREATDAFCAAHAADSKYLSAASNYLFALNARDDLTPAYIASEHRRVGAQHETAAFLNRGAGARRRHSRIRVGYVAAKFHRHTGAQFFEPVLNAHDRLRFEIFCYRNNDKADAVTARLRLAAEHWRDIHAMDDDAAAARIAADEIDVLVDMDGHTRDNRLALFARRAAPVQVTWLGYPNTTGLAAMDYRITDSIADQGSDSDGRHTEKLLRLDPVFLPLAPLEFAPKVGPLPARKKRFVQFACFNELHKLSDSAVGMMARVLLRAAGSRLMLKSRALADLVICDEQRQRFARFGVDPSRIDCCAGAADRRAYLGLHNEVDIALDTFPYTGTTTTCEALWMGVPVVTLEGVTHCQRVSSSLLRAAGLAELAARDPEEYVSIASGLAGDLRRLASMRCGMRDRLKVSPLMDVAAFTRRLEKGFEEMVRRRPR